MRKLLVVFFLTFAGCGGGCSVNQDFVETCQESWETIKPEYVEYVKEDESLTTESKEIRIKTANNLSQLLEEASND